MTGPVRIVHIGDSHVRGHLYPLITRRRLEHDFGAEAVYPDVISYRTGGLAHETGEPGIVYHMIGINGATSVTFSDDEKIKEIASLHPDLIIVVIVISRIPRCISFVSPGMRSGSNGRDNAGIAS